MMDEFDQLAQEIASDPFDEMAKELTATAVAEPPRGPSPRDQLRYGVKPAFIEQDPADVGPDPSVDQLGAWAAKDAKKAAAEAERQRMRAQPQGPLDEMHPDAKEKMLRQLFNEAKLRGLRDPEDQEKADFEPARSGLKNQFPSRFVDDPRLQSFFESQYKKWRGLRHLAKQAEELYTEGNDQKKADQLKLMAKLSPEDRQEFEGLLEEEGARRDAIRRGYSEAAARQHSFRAPEGLLGSVFSGVARGGNTLLGLGARLVGDSDAARGLYDEKNAMRAAADKVNPGLLARSIGGAAESLTAIAPSLGAGPAGPIVMGALTSANDAYEDAKAKGLSDGAALKHALANGALEGGIAGIFQMVGAGGAESLLAHGTKGTFRESVKQVAKGLGHELLEEELTTLSQQLASRLSGVDRKAINPEVILQAVIDTAAQTGVMVGAAGVPSIARAGLDKSNRAPTQGEQQLEQILARQAQEPKQIKPEDAARELPGELAQPLKPEEASRSIFNAWAKAHPEAKVDITVRRTAEERAEVINQYEQSKKAEVGVSEHGAKLPPEIPPGRNVQTAPESTLPSEPSPKPAEAKIVEPAPQNEAPAPAQAEARPVAKDGISKKVAEPQITPAPKGVVEAGRPTVDFKLVDKDGKPSMEQAHVEKIFPGASVKDQGAAGFRVTFKSGKFVDVRQVPKIEISDEQWAAAKEAYPELDDSDRQDAKVAGSMEIIAGNTRVNGIALMRLATGYANDATARHEALHLADRMGMFSQAEWDALVKDYSDPSKSRQAQAEDIANAREEWTGERSPRAENRPSLGSKIMDFAKGLLVKMGFKKFAAKATPDAPGLTGEDVHALMDSAQFWEREMKSDPSGKKFVDLVFKPWKKANPAFSEGARDFVDQERSKQPQAAVKSDEVTFAAANKILSSARRSEALKNKMLKGAELNPEETVAAKHLIEDAASKALDSTEAFEFAQSLLIGYDKGGSDLGRSMRQRRDSIETPAQRFERMTMEAILRPGAADLKLILDAEKAGDSAKAARLRKKAAENAAAFAKEHGVTKAEVKKRSAAKDIPWFAGLARAKSARDSSITDVMYEWYVNALLSGPETQVVNAGGTALFAAWVQIVERSLAAPFKGKGEIKARWSGFRQGWSDGFANAIMSFKTETPYFEHAHKREGEGDFTQMHARAAWSGAKGRVIRWPGRFALAMDTFNKSLLGRMEVGSMALAEAKRKGLSDDAAEKFMAAEIANPVSDSWNKAIDQAQIDTFNRITTPLGQATRDAARKFTKYVKVAKFFPFTFINTPIGIVERAYERSPLTILHYLPEVLHRARTGEWSGAAKDPDRLVRAALSAGLLIGMSKLLEEDEEGNPRITGAFPPGPESDAKYRRGWQPYSIRIGDTWYSFGRIEPLATVVGTMADVMNKPADILGALEATASAMQSKTFIKDLGNLLGLATMQGTREDKISKIEEMGLDKAAAFIPNVFKQVGRSVGDDQPERRQWGKGAERDSRMWRRLGQKTETGLVKDQPKIDAWGAVVKKPNAWGPDFLNPIDKKIQGEVFMADKLIANYNKTAEKPYNIPQPSKTYTVKDESGKKTTKYMTDEQYMKFSKLAGETAKQAILEEKEFNVKNPGEGDIKAIQKIIAAARKYARATVLQVETEEEE